MSDDYEYDPNDIDGDGINDEWEMVAEQERRQREAQYQAELDAYHRSLEGYGSSQRLDATQADNTVSYAFTGLTAALSIASLVLISMALSTALVGVVPVLAVVGVTLFSGLVARKTHNSIPKKEKNTVKQPEEKQSEEKHRKSRIPDVSLAPQLQQGGYQVSWRSKIAQDNQQKEAQIAI